MKALKIYITGKVQGVWYRASTRNKAKELGLCGMVRNESDGSVYAEVEGPVEGVDQLVVWCKEGPPHARVDSVRIEEMDWQGREGFSIER